MRGKVLTTVGAVLLVGSVITWISLTRGFNPDALEGEVVAAPSLPPSSDQITLTSSAQTPPAEPQQAVDVSDAKKLLPADFRAFTRQILTTLPRQEDLRSLGEKDAHLAMPEPLIDAGQKLGQIAQLIHDNAKLQDEGLGFYLDCASVEGLSTSVRALCLASLWKLQKQTGKAIAVSSAENFPDNVTEIAKQLD